MFSLLVVSVSLGVVSTVVPDSPHKLFIGGLPNYLNDDQVFNWKQTGQVHSCFLILLSHAEVALYAQNMFYISLWHLEKKKKNCVVVERKSKKLKVYQSQKQNVTPEQKYNKNHTIEKT